MLKQMLKICKKEKEIIVEGEGREKYLRADNVFAYIGEEAPEWRYEDCAIALDLTQDDLEKYTVGNSDFCFLNKIAIDDIPKLERSKYSVNVDGVPYQPFILPDKRLFFVDMEKLRVFKDEGIKNYGFTICAEREYLIVMIDNRIIGAVAAARLNLDTMYNFASGFYNGVRRSKETDFCDAGGQMSLE